MKTFKIPDGATHVIVEEGPLSFVVPALDSENRLAIWSDNSKRMTEDEVKKKFHAAKAYLPQGVEVRLSLVREIVTLEEITNEEIAEAVGYKSIEAVNNIFRGHSNPNKKFVLYLAKRGGIEPIDLLMWEEA